MWVVLPAKNFFNAKQRLAGLLTPQERRNLFQAMLEDVLSVLSAHPLIQGVVLVSDDPVAKLLAQQYQVECLNESSLLAIGLNAVVQAAVKVLAMRGIHEVMVIHGDLPLISFAEITELITTHRKATRPALTLAPDRHREGTNCLICTPATAINYCYGNLSLSKHLHEGAKIGASVQLVDLPGVGFDIDWPDDVLTLINRPDLTAARHTSSYLKNSGIVVRARAMSVDGPHLASPPSSMDLLHALA
ncbi:MAG: 2-phospho-L-lactate guanylyltransferase [Gallionella sp.]|nr:2-phospho-L-lactate guanylyltransferase [Gallionella sp.]